jgi:hypothetical protein
VAYNFKIGKNKIKLLTEDESLTQKVLFDNAVLTELMFDWLSYTFFFRKQFYFVVSGLKIVGHGNPDNNLESSCRIEKCL